MPTNQNGVRRRDALKLVGGAVGATLGAAGVAAGDTAKRLNVGYSSVLGRQAALAVADEVVYDFSFDALTLDVPLDALTTLDGAPGIRYVEEDGRVEAIDQTLPWGIDRVDAEVAHENGHTGDGADIAIIDTGIDDGHPDLEANLGEGASFVGPVQTNQWNDDNGHGSHCAGIADAVDNSEGVVGVSTEATLHAVKVLSAVGVGSTSDVAMGVNYVGDKGWDVGSMSLGGGESEVLKDACQYAWNEGVFLSAAAGNAGPCEDCVSYPAANDFCVAVSATDKNDNLAGFSSQGPEVELAAPGVDIYSTYVAGTYETLSGTSMSCPHVSGAAGQLMADGSSNDEALDQLKNTAESIGLSDVEGGAGLLDVAAALGENSDDDLNGGGGGGGSGSEDDGLLGLGLTGGLL